MADYVKFKEDKEEDSSKQIKKKRTKISFKGILLFFLILFILSSIISSFVYTFTPKIVVVPIKGVITTEKSDSVLSGSTISSREIANKLNSLKYDTSVKAVLIDINSPGGSPVASEEISLAIESLKKEKPVYALVNDVGASGGFWVAVAADKVYASSMSTLGSIGVTSAGLSFENFIKQYNITYRKQTAGEYKDMGSPYRNMTQEEQKIIQEILDDVHTKFITHIANSRSLSYEYVQNYSTGEIFLGEKAKTLGFIDEIGYYNDAIDALKNVTNSPNVLIETYIPEPSLAEIIGVNSIFNTPSTKGAVMLE